MYDAIIIGTGPAGSACAITLSKEGKKVLLIDKCKLPRYKACGGGLSQKSTTLLKQLNIPLEKVIENGIDDVDFIYKYINNVRISFDYTTIEMTMRSKLDFLMAQKAESYGAQLIDSEKVLSVIESDDHVTVTTGKSIYKGKYLIGADGAHSLVAKKFNLQKNTAMAVEGEIKITPEITYPTSIMELHYGIIPHGYGWVFPKGEVLSIGIGSFLPTIKGLNKYYYDFKRNIGLENHKEIVLKAHPIPLLKEKEPLLHSDRIFLTGDAAGLVDPLCGEGIYYALQTGIWAATAILEDNPQKYSSLVNNEILPELKKAEVLSRIIYNGLPVINRIVNSNPTIAQCLLEVVYGKESYQSFLQHLLSKYSIFRKALS